MTILRTFKRDMNIDAPLTIAFTEHNRVKLLSSTVRGHCSIFSGNSSFHWCGVPNAEVRIFRSYYLIFAPEHRLTILLVTT